MNTLNVVESIFIAALERGIPEARGAFLEEACNGDANLRQCVERLLNAHAKADNILPAQAPGLPNTIEPPPIEERPGSIIGPFKLLQQLGEGGFGVVFMAEQEQPVRRRVALKIIKPGMDSRQVVARFEAERQALAIMDHPNIARVLDGGTTESGRPYFVMELVKGIPITEFCDQNRLTPRERLELFIPVCQAVQHAHQKGIIHRDIKPSNVLVTMYDNKAVPKVIDFGVAKAIEQKLTEQTLFTRVGQIIGTLEYMSPEQASLNALDVDTRADVYALGVLLYELLTGTTPLNKERLKEVAFLELLRLIREEEPPRPSMRLSESGDALTAYAVERRSDSQKLPKLVQGELDWIAMKALEKDRARRYAAPSDLVADVRRYLNDELVEARPPSVGYRLRKYVRKHKALVGATCAVALALLVGLATTSWQAVRAMDAEADAVDKWVYAEDQRELARLSAETAKENERLMAKQRDIAIAERGKADWRLYAANVERARREWEDNDLNLVHHYLKQCPAGFRGWEHDLLFSQAHYSQQTLFKQAKGYIAAVAFNPDGHPLVCTSTEMYSHNLSTGQEFRKPIKHSKAAVFSADGKLLATVVDDKSIIVWDVATGEIRKSWEAHAAPIWSVAFSPDGTLLASGTQNPNRDGGLKVWNVSTGKEVHTLSGHANTVMSLAFSADGKYLVSGSWDSTLKLWDISSGQLVRTFTGHTRGVRSVAYSPKGNIIASASADKSIRLWDVDSGNEVSKFDEQTIYFYVAFSPDGTRLASASNLADGGRGNLRHWDVATGKELPRPKGKTANLYFLAFSPDGKRIVTGAENAEVTLWDATVPSATTFNDGRLACAAVSSDSNQVAFVSTKFDKSFNSLFWTFVSHRLEIGAGKQVHSVPLEAAWPFVFDKTPQEFAFSSDIKRVAAINLKAITHADDATFSSRTVLISDTETGKEIRALVAKDRPICSLAFSPNGNFIAAGCESGVAPNPQAPIVIWDAATGQLLRTLDGHEAGVSQVEFSPDNRYLVSASSEYIGPPRKPKDRKQASGKTLDVKLWDATTGRLIRTFPGETCVAFGPDGRTVASVSKGTVVHVWDAETGKERLSLQENVAPIKRLAFHPGGKRLASASADGVVRLWDTGSGQEVLAVRLPVNSNVRIESLAFSPNGKHLVCAWANGVKIWDASLSMHDSDTN